MSKFFDTGFEVIILTTEGLVPAGTNHIYVPNIQHVEIVERCQLTHFRDDNYAEIKAYRIRISMANGEPERYLNLRRDASGDCPRLQKFLDIVNSMRD